MANQANTNKTTKNTENSTKPRGEARDTRSDIREKVKALLVRAKNDPGSLFKALELYDEKKRRGVRAAPASRSVKKVDVAIMTFEAKAKQAVREDCTATADDHVAKEVSTSTADLIPVVTEEAVVQRNVGDSTDSSADQAVRGGQLTSTYRQDSEAAPPRKNLKRKSASLDEDVSPRQRQCLREVPPAEVQTRRLSPVREVDNRFGREGNEQNVDPSRTIELHRYFAFQDGVDYEKALQIALAHSRELQ